MIDRVNGNFEVPGNQIFVSTYHLPLLAEESMTLHGVVGVCGDEVEHMVVGGIRRAIGNSE